MKFDEIQTSLQVRINAERNIDPGHVDGDCLYHKTDFSAKKEDEKFHKEKENPGVWSESKQTKAVQRIATTCKECPDISKQCSNAVETSIHSTAERSSQNGKWIWSYKNLNKML